MFRSTRCNAAQAWKGRATLDTCIVQVSANHTTCKDVTAQPPMPTISFLSAASAAAKACNWGCFAKGCVASLAGFGEGGGRVVGVGYADPRRLAGAWNARDVLRQRTALPATSKILETGQKPKAAAHFQIFI